MHTPQLQLHYFGLCWTVLRGCKTSLNAHNKEIHINTHTPSNPHPECQQWRPRTDRWMITSQCFCHPKVLWIPSLVSLHKLFAKRKQHSFWPRALAPAIQLFIFCLIFKGTEWGSRAEKHLNSKVQNIQHPQSFSFTHFKGGENYTTYFAPGTNWYRDRKDFPQDHSKNCSSRDECSSIGHCSLLASSTSKDLGTHSEVLVYRHRV